MDQSTLTGVSFRLKGDLSLALKSIGIRDLVKSISSYSQYCLGLTHSLAIDQESVLLSRSSLGQNYPNPFNPEIWIPYQLASSEEVLVKIHNVAGHMACQIDVGLQSAGDYTPHDKAVYWDGRNEFGEQPSSGIYYYTICAGEYIETRKMLLLK